MMAKGYSKDLRAVSIMEAARLLDLGASTTIRWIDRWTRTVSVDALPVTGHSRSPLKKHERWLLDLVAAEPDLALNEIVICSWPSWI
jgi:transposase